MNDFSKVFLALLHFWVFVFFPTVHANYQYSIEVFNDGNIEKGHFNQYLTVTEKVSDGHEKLIHKIIFSRTEEKTAFFPIQGHHIPKLQSSSFLGELELHDHQIKYQLKADGSLKLTTTKIINNNPEIISTIIAKAGKNKVEPFKFSFQENQDKKGFIVTESMPSHLDYFQLKNKNGWINRSTFTLQNWTEFQGSHFRNEGHINFEQGGVLKYKEFHNTQGAKINTLSDLKLNTTTALNRGTIYAERTMGIGGETFTNDGELYLQQCRSTAKKFVNKKNITGVDNIILNGTDLYLEKGSFLHTDGKVAINFNTWKHKGFLKGNEIFFKTGKIKPTLFKNEGIIYGNCLIEGNIRGWLKNWKKTSTSSGGEFVCEKGKLKLEATKSIQNYNFLAALNEMVLAAPDVVHSLRNGKLLTKNLKVTSRGKIEIAHKLGEKISSSINSVILEGRSVKVDDIFANKSVKIVSSEREPLGKANIKSKTIVSKLGEVTLDGVSIISQGIDALKKIILKASNRLELEGEITSRKDRIEVNTAELDAKKANFIGKKGVFWETSFYKGHQEKPGEGMFSLKIPPQKMSDPIYFKEAQYKSLEKLKQSFADLNKITINLEKGLTLDRNFSCSWNLCLKIPETSSQGLNFKSYLHAEKGLKLICPNQSIKIGEEFIVQGSVDPAILTGFLKAEKGQLDIDCFSLTAPVAKFFAEKGITIKTKKFFNLGGHFYRKKSISYFYPVICVHHEPDQGGFTIPNLWTYAGRRKDLRTVQGKISNGSFLVSNGAIKLDCGNINFFYPEIRTSKELKIISSGTFNSYSASLFAYGDSKLKAKEIKIDEEITIEKIRPKPIHKFNNYQYAIMEGKVPYVFGPMHRIIIEKDFQLTAKKASICTDILSIGGKLKKSGEVLLLKDLIIKPQFVFKLNERNVDQIQGLTQAQLGKNKSSVISSSSVIEMCLSKKISTGASVLQAPVINATTKELSIGLTSNIRTPIGRSFKSLHDLSSHQKTSQEFFKIMGTSQYLFLPEVPLNHPIHSHPPVITNGEGLTSNRITKRFLMNPLQEIEAIAHALNGSLCRAYLTLKNGQILKTPLEIWAFSLQNAHKLEKKLLQGTSEQKKKLTRNDLMQGDDPLIFYEEFDYVHKGGKVEKVLKPYFYLPKFHDSIPQIHSGEGGVFSNSVNINANFFELTSILYGKEGIRIKADKAIIRKRQYTWVETVYDKEVKKDWRGTSTKLTKRTINRRETQEESGQILSGGTLELNIGKKLDLYAPTIRAKKIFMNIEKLNSYPLVDNFVTCIQSQARGFMKRQKILSHQMIPFIRSTEIIAEDGISGRIGNMKLSSTKIISHKGDIGFVVKENALFLAPTFQADLGKTVSTNGWTLTTSHTMKDMAVPCSIIAHNGKVKLVVEGLIFGEGIQVEGEIIQISGGQVEFVTKELWEQVSQQKTGISSNYKKVNKSKQILKNTHLRPTFKTKIKNSNNDPEEVRDEKEEDSRLNFEPKNVVMLNEPKPGDISIESTKGDIILQIPDMASAGKIDIKAERKIYLKHAKSIISVQEQGIKQNHVIQTVSNEGSIHEVPKMPNIIAKDGIFIKAKKGIEVDLKATAEGNLDATLRALERQSGLQWIQNLKNREDVNWHLIKEHHVQWCEEHTGLTPAASALLTVAITIATSGLGTEIALAMNLAEAGLGATAISMVSTAFQSVITKTAVSIVQNNGDLSKAFKDLTSSNTAKALLVDVLTAGIVGNPSLNSLKTSSSVNYASLFASHLKKNLLQNTVQACVSKAIEGGDFKENLVEGLKSAAVWATAATAANYIGDKRKGIVRKELSKQNTLNQNNNNNQPKKMDWLTHKVSHGVLGGFTAKVLGKDVASGAIGAVVGEIVAEQQAKSLTKKLEKGAVSEEEFQTLRANGIKLARFASATTAFLIDGDPQTASQIALNAAENNGLDLEFFKKLQKYLQTIDTEEIKRKGLDKLVEFTDNIDELEENNPCITSVLNKGLSALSQGSRAVFYLKMAAIGGAAGTATSFGVGAPVAAPVGAAMGLGAAYGLETLLENIAQKGIEHVAASAYQQGRNVEEAQRYKTAVYKAAIILSKYCQIKGLSKSLGKIKFRLNKSKAVNLPNLNKNKQTTNAPLNTIENTSINQTISQRATNSNAPLTGPNLLKPRNPKNSILYENYWTESTDFASLFENGTVGARQALRKNILKEYPELKKMSKWQAHHVIPWDMHNNQMLKRLKLNLNNYQNGAPLPTEIGGCFAEHCGPHGGYNIAFKEFLIQIEKLKVSDSQKKKLVVTGIEKARQNLISGKPALKAPNNFKGDKTKYIQLKWEKIFNEILEN